MGIEGVTTTTTSSVLEDDSETERFLTYLPFILTTIFCIIVRYQSQTFFYRLTMPQVGTIMICIGPEVTAVASGKVYSRF